MNDQLKPCPFCGGEASILIYSNQIRCNKCESQTDQFNTMDEAVVVWNTRHSDPDVTENEKVAFGNGRLQFKEYIKKRMVKNGLNNT